MEKLGFAIKLASQGAANVIECNRGSWTNKVVDIREYLKLFNGLQGTDNVVSFISFDEQGCYLTLLRAISGRGGDFLSGWIYIPNSIEISGEEIENVYKYVIRILSMSNLSEVKLDIENFFIKEYPRKKCVINYIPSSGNEFGVRFIGYHNYAEILGSNRYQTYYSKFKAVFLLEKEGTVQIAGDSVHRFKDLTKLPIEQLCILKAPTAEESQLFGNGVKIYFSNGKEFTSSLIVKKGDKIKLFAKKEGYEPYTIAPFIVEQELQSIPIPINILWRKTISTSMFKITDENGLTVKSPKILINNIDITYQDAVLSENELRNSKIVVKAPEFAEYSSNMNLIIKPPYQIELVRNFNECKYQIRMINGEDAKMILESRYLPSSSKYNSPLKAYTYDIEDRTLTLSTVFVWKQRLYGFISCIITAILLFLLYGLNNGFPWENEYDEMEQNDIYASEDTIQQNIANNDLISFDDAIAYLESNEEWSKNSLEKYPITQGLFDELNNYEFDNIRMRESLFKNSAFEEIAMSIKKSEEMRIKLVPPYNKDVNDTIINITNYIKNITTSTEPQAKEANSPLNSGISSKNTNHNGTEDDSNQSTLDKISNKP